MICTAGSIAPDALRRSASPFGVDRPALSIRSVPIRQSAEATSMPCVAASCTSTRLATRRLDETRTATLLSL